MLVDWIRCERNNQRLREQLARELAGKGERP